jgi:amino acid adenylation domain-containing protein
MAALEDLMHVSALSRTVLEGFDQTAARAPHDVAVTCGDRSMTYEELDALANSIAWRLHERGVGPESVVGICLPRGLDMAAAVLGVLKASAGYLPLEPEYPDERLRMVLSDSGATALVAQQPVRDRLSRLGWTKPVLESGNGTADTPPAQLAGPGNLQYVIYTSGSTGQPKGIAMQHGPQISLLDWSRERYRECPVALQYFPIATDVASLELLSAWWSGGQMVIATERDRFDIGAIARLIRQHAITKILLPVVAMQQLARYAVEHPEDVSTLRELITTGDRLTITPEIRLMCERLPDVYLDDHFGSTEVNVVTAPRHSAPSAAWPDSPPVGSPIAGARVYVLDERQNPNPPNVPGEIYIGSDPLARGYLGRSALTAASFVPDPFSPVPGSRMYRTGDLGRWRTGGVLECLGRADLQIKLRGYRIEPGEIETLLRARNDVKQAAVVALAEGTAGGTEDLLVAYVVPAELPAGQVLHTEPLREHLAARLPTFMIPQTFVVLDEMPLTDTGKIDRRRLPSPGTVEPPFVAPRDDIESAIAEVWADSLGLEAIGVKHNFFQLGGHSLLVTRIVYQLRESLEIDFPLAAMFERPTVESFAVQARSLLAAES